MTNNFKTLSLSLVISFQLLAAPVARAAIQYGSDTYQAPFAASTTEQVGGLVKGVDLNNLNSSSSISAGLGFFGKVKQFFINLDQWMKDKAGIDFFGILTTIGHWFVITLEWIIKGLKMVL